MLLYATYNLLVSYHILNFLDRFECRLFRRVTVEGSSKLKNMMGVINVAVERSTNRPDLRREIFSYYEAAHAMRIFSIRDLTIPSG